jgi:alanine-glyoxylate transaminase / serine-glyoxylate transaminase / serine-pyruvate transaminase
LKARKTTNRSWYFDLTLLNDYFHVSHKYHHTASATLFYALHEGLTLIQEEGFENRTARHHRMHLRFVNEVEALGLKMHVAEGHRIWNLNTPRIPDGVDDAKVRKYLLEKYGIEILGGFGQLAGKVFRIGVMGPLATDENVSMFFEKFKEALNAQ